MDWFILYVKPRNEKKVALKLEKLGLTIYCPLIIQRKQWSDRIKKVEVPLINSYIFGQLKEKERNMVFQISGVVRYLFWLGKPAIARDKEIQTLKKWLSGEILDASIEKLEPGDAMKISSGPFIGKDGIIEKITKNNVQLLLRDVGIIITLSRSIA